MYQSQFIEMFGNGNWEHKTLGEVGSFKRGGGFQKSDFVERGIPCIHYGQIHTRFGPFIYSHLTDISSDLESKTKFAEKGDLIIAITSEDTEGSCKSTAWLGDYPVAVGGHAAIFHHCMNPVYMSFFFKSALFNYAKREYVHGTKVCEIKPDDIAKIFVPCPPISLQEDFSMIAQQADKSKFSGLKSQFIEMFKGCKMTQLKKVACFSKASINPIKGVKYTLFSFPAFDNNCIPEFVDGGEIKSSKIKLEDNVILYNKLNVRLSRVWNINELSSNNNVCSSEFLPVKVTDKDLITKSFLYRILCSEDVTKKMVACSTGTSNSQKRITPASLLSLDIPIPSMEEQMKFVAIAEQADKSKQIAFSRAS